ncbi:MAG: choice-of-anchor J domain-containing protein [Bacteroidales bacterium]|nr:choice-of-anchor J domain-containing protein [Bacteroidales bacterium]
MTNKHIFLLGCMTGLLALTSCELEDRTYQGPEYFEFSAKECEQAPVSNILTKEVTKGGENLICVQLIKPSTTDVKVNFRLADQLFYILNTSSYANELPAGIKAGEYEVYSTTAKYGVDYEFNNTNGLQFDAKYQRGSITIPAGQMFGYIPVNVLQRKNKKLCVILEDSETTMANKPTSMMSVTFMAEKTIYFNESFYEELPDTWTALDGDGDGHTWYYYEKRQCLYSDSYFYADDGSEYPLNPENYLISPAISIPSDSSDPELNFALAASANGAYQEQYKVLVSTSPITLSNVDKADVVRDWTELTADYKKRTFQTEKISLAPYVGKTIYICWVHGNCTDMESILMKDVVVFGF